MKRRTFGIALLVALLNPAIGVKAFGDEVPALGIRLENYEYPFPVSNYVFETQKQTLEMAYMDVKPEDPNGETVILLHGKNFSGAYWEETAKALSGKGYRVVIPDQIGFGKSSKPEHYQYTFQSLATNTLGLLDKLSIKKKVKRDAEANTGQQDVVPRELISVVRVGWYNRCRFRI